MTVPLSNIWQGTVFILFSVIVISGRPHCSNENKCHYGICDEVTGKCINCPENRTGYLCEKIRDVCSLKQDKCNRRNGICRPASNDLGYVCYCNTASMGIFCDEPKNPCQLDNFCNGGTCLYVPLEERSYDCICPIQLTGDNCEIELDLCQEMPGYCGDHSNGCRNNVCSCEEGYGGQRCDRRVPTEKEYMLAGKEGTITCHAWQDCAKRHGDGRCDNFCNIHECLYDGYDCEDKTSASKMCSPSCKLKSGNAVCDEECNISKCNYDGKDCMNWILSHDGYVVLMVIFFTITMIVVITYMYFCLF